MTTPDKPAIPAELVDQMIALLQRMLHRRGSFGAGMDWDEARTIVADLPKPVDPDLIEARKLASELKWPYADHEAVAQAIKRGRELERSATPAHGNDGHRGIDAPFPGNSYFDGNRHD